MKSIIFVALPVVLAIPVAKNQSPKDDAETLQLPTSSNDIPPDNPCVSYPGYEAAGSAALNLYFLPEVDGGQDSEKGSMEVVPLSEENGNGRLILDNASSPPQTLQLQCLDSTGLRALIPPTLAPPTLIPTLPSTFPSLRLGGLLAPQPLSPTTPRGPTYRPLRISTDPSSPGSLTFADPAAPSSGDGIPIEVYGPPRGGTKGRVTGSTAVYLGARGAVDWGFEKVGRDEGKWEMRLLVPGGEGLRRGEVRGHLKIWRCPEGFKCGVRASNIM